MKEMLLIISGADVTFASNMPNFCTKTSAIWQFIGYALFALKILIPLIIIILGVIDFSKAVVVSDDKSISKASVTLIQRVILGICVFFIPTIVNLVVGLITDIAQIKDEAEGCYTCLLDPTGTECDNKKAEAKASR